MRKRQASGEPDGGAQRPAPSVQRFAAAPVSPIATQGFLMRQLNKQFAAWVEKAAAENAGESWVPGVRDYIKHAERIEADAATPTPAADPAPASAGTSPLPRAPAAAAPAPALWAPAPPTANPAVSPFAGGFGAGAWGSAAAPFPGAGVFGAPLVATPVAAAEEEDDEPARPPSPSLAENAADEVLHAAKCKVFYRLPGLDGAMTWRDKGVGRLTLRRDREPPVDGGKPAPHRINVRNEAGRPLLIANLQPGLKVAELNKTALMLSLYCKADDAAEFAHNSIMVKVGSAEAATELKAKIESLVT